MFGMTISEVVHETTKGLYGSGGLSDARMREYDLMCLSDFKNLPAREIRRVRTGNKMSLDLFADYLQVSKHTLQKWEQGKAKPNGPSLRLLNLVADKGLDFLVAHKGPVVPPLNVQKAKADSDKKAKRGNVQKAGKTRSNPERSRRDMKAVA